MEEYDISQWRLAGPQIHTPSDPKMATGVRTGFTAPMGPKNKKCTSQDGTMEECEPLGQFFEKCFSNM